MTEDILSRSTAERMLADRAHLIDGLPLVCDQDGSELGFFRADVEAMRAGTYRHMRYALGHIERIDQR
ncbi:MAG: hypothetical protein ACK53A_12145 [Gemmatimonadota bacterium]|jgi:hypothetical protein